MILSLVVVGVGGSAKLLGGGRAAIDICRFSDFLILHQRMVGFRRYPIGCGGNDLSCLKHLRYLASWYIYFRLITTFDNYDLVVPLGSDGAVDACRFVNLVRFTHWDRVLSFQAFRSDKISN